jgi:hypothetical protein
LRTVGPAAVRIVTFRITVGVDGNGRYVLGKGSALGVELAPCPMPAVVLAAVSLLIGAGDCFATADEQATAASTAAIAALRIAAVVSVGW